MTDVIIIIFSVLWITAIILLIIYGPKRINTTGIKVRVLDWLFPGRHFGQRTLPTLERIRRGSILTVRILWGMVILLVVALLIWFLIIKLTQNPSL